MRVRDFIPIRTVPYASEARKLPFYFQQKNAVFTEGVSKILSYRPIGLASKINVFPNPVSDVFQVETLEKVKKIEAIDATGRVFTLPFTASTNGVAASVSGLATGLFQIKITTERGESQRFSMIKK